VARLVATIVLATGCFLGLGILAERWVHRTGYRNMRVCLELKPGMSSADLQAKLGEPRVVVRAGETWWYFESPWVAAAPIRALIEVKSGQVVSLNCSESERW